MNASTVTSNLYLCFGVAEIVTVLLGYLGYNDDSGYLITPGPILRQEDDEA